MKTDDLINLLAEDAPVSRSLTRGLAIALVSGALLSGLFLLATIGIRSDIAEAVQTLRVIFKIGLTFVLAATACNLVFRIGKPGVALRPSVVLLFLPLVFLGAGVIAELFVTPAGEWKTALVGRYSAFCLVYIPLLSFVPLAAFLRALKGGAPENPVMAGAAAGLAAGAIGAAIYAWHCPDDSPLFIASWYTIAVAFVTLCGGLAGRSLLRW
ncbi:NrsF family protein [Rhizobium sp. S95]|uniref:NrsF family protein n=1 Tax=Ciceribacter sichuanensis TaxID=2949647 RepID=A0AAJ1C0G6_9HYPH|nr:MULTISPECIES: NrsF family protein [unclassified Ciceribacter]MCM2395865.1 NrsF family protein [Ciceribacter sp. S95]MCO5959534.1 NrsF family protein [Ciceribacter sp. S101]